MIKRKFYAGVIDNDLLIYTCTIYEKCKLYDHPRITVSFEDKEDVKTRVDEILTTLNK
jgi:hypothetical protein